MAGFVGAEQVGVGAYLTAAANTTCTDADTFYAISGTFENDPLKGFTLGASAIVYSGRTRYFEIDWHATIEGDSNSIVAHIGAAIAGETLTIASAFVMGVFLKTSSEPLSLSGTRVVELSAGDTIQLQCAADGAGDVLTFDHFTTTIRPFFFGGE